MFGQLGYRPIAAPLSWLDVGTEQENDVADPEAAGPRSELSGIDPDQFTLFQLTDRAAPQPILDLHAAKPTLKGSDKLPDVRMRIELVSFRIAPSEDVTPDMQATLRLDIGRSQNGSAEEDALFWSIAAGLDLTAQALTPGPEQRQAGSDLSKAFRKNPVEIAGGLGDLRIELVAHTPPPWWRKIFTFADNSAVRKLVDAVGFPGIALDAVKLLDTAMGRFEDARAKPIFRSRPMTVALTERAAQDFGAGLDTMQPAVLNDGVYVLLRHRQAELVRATPPLFLGGYGRLVPRDSWDGQTLKLPEKDPYSDLSYEIMRVKTREIAIESSV